MDAADDQQRRWIAEELALAARWARVVFERWRLLRGSLARGDERLLDPSPATTALAGAAPVAAPLAGVLRAIEDTRVQRAAERPPPWTLLASRFALAPIEADALLLLTVYQLDGALQRLYAEETGRSPRLTFVALAELLAPTPLERLALDACLGPDGPLRSYRLVLVGDAMEGPGLGGRPLEVHDRIVEIFEGDRGLDARLRVSASLLAPSPDDAGWQPASVTLAVARALAAAGSDRPRMLLSGPDEGAKPALLAATGTAVLSVDLAKVALAPSPPDALREHLREAVFHDALLYLDAHHLPELAPSLRVTLTRVLDAWPRALAIGSDVASPLDLAGPRIAVRVGLPDAAMRERLWREGLTEAGAEPPPDQVLRDVARRFLLGGRAIRAAAAEAALEARAANTGPGFDQLCQAARQRQTHHLGRFAQRVEQRSRVEDLIASERCVQSLYDIVMWVRHHDRVFRRWGFGRRFARGTGLSALFHGLPGTGKTMAASIIADALDMELFKVDLSKVTSMWIGESEKQLAELFDQAIAADAMLLFDEADSLFAKRTDVRTSVDRYANLGVNFLLQRIEDFPGVCILTTNKPENLDEAFRRRLRFHVEFALPDQAERRQLWASMLPAECETRGRFDFDRLAATYELGGGNIQNAVLRAAFLAAEANRPLDESLLRVAADEEYQALGRLVASRRGV